MSAIEQLPDGSALEPRRREPPPLVFAAAAERAAKPVIPKPPDRQPISQAASRRHKSWLRRFCALVVLLVAIGGVGTAVKDSKITLPAKHHVDRHASTLLSAEQLGLTRHHGKGAKGRHHKGAATRHHAARK